ncbi:MAG: hypothetical protein PVG75_09365 [Thioalkalispiraceae bacterium]|jgi:hypothetical protein
MNNVNLKVLSIVSIISLGMLASIGHASRDHRDRDDYKKRSKDYRYDKRYHHDRYYPRSGIRLKILPRRHYPIRYRDSLYYFSAGIWYRSSGGVYVVVRPPLGIVVPVLPPFYTTLWFYGVPYYYANDVYYVWRPDLNGYVVTEAPADSKQDPVPLSDQLFIYPKQGQSEQQQADDRFACHRWAVEQTGYDPTQPPRDRPVEELNGKRQDYQRAMRSCLEGRGYSVK